jgi:hypothetical protein
VRPQSRRFAWPANVLSILTDQLTALSTNSAPVAPFRPGAGAGQTATTLEQEAR